jgi:hypothetical protein
MDSTPAFALYALDSACLAVTHALFVFLVCFIATYKLRSLKGESKCLFLDRPNTHGKEDADPAHSSG